MGYDYSVQADFPNARINEEALKREITLSSIAKQLRWIEQIGDRVSISFSDLLDAGEQATLDGLIAAHDGKPSADSIVLIQEENDETDGTFQMFGALLRIPHGTTSTHDFSWPYPVSVLTTHFRTGERHRCDRFTMVVGPDTVIGVLTAPVSPGDTVLNVSPTVVQYITNGSLAALFDGVATKDELGRCIDRSSSTITVETPAANAFAAGSPILMTKVAVDNFHVTEPDQYIIGESKIGSTFIPSNTTVRVIWTATDPVRIIGTITAPAAASDTVITVDDAVLAKVTCFESIELDDGVNQSSGEIVAMDMYAKTVTLDTPLAFGFASGAEVRWLNKILSAKVELLQ